MKAMKAEIPTMADLERTLRIIYDSSKTAQQKMRELTTPGAIPGRIQRRIACRIARWTPVPGDDSMADLHGKDPLATEAVRVAERHAIGLADDGDLEEIRGRIREATEGQEDYPPPRLRGRIGEMSWSAFAATAEADPATALEKTSRLAKEVVRAAEMLRGARRIGGAATHNEIEGAYVRACEVAEGMLTEHLTIARLVVREWLGR